MSKHTPAPWKLSYFGFLENDTEHILLPKVSTLKDFPCTTEYMKSIAYSNAQRIVACVNALEGVEDPFQFVKEAKELKDMYEALNQLYK